MFFFSLFMTKLVYQCDKTVVLYYKMQIFIIKLEFYISKDIYEGT